MESGMAIKATLIIISNSLKILRWFVKNLNQKKNWTTTDTRLEWASAVDDHQSHLEIAKEFEDKLAWESAMAIFAMLVMVWDNSQQKSSIIKVI